MNNLSSLNICRSPEKSDKEEEEAESSESSSEKEEKVPVKKPKVKVEKDESPKEQKPPKAVKSTSQASYIMKLFDRSVNLAKFTEDSSLYPLCRSWMQNAPRQLAPKADQNPEPTIISAEEGDVVEIPKVRIRKGGKPLLSRKSEINKEELDKLIDSDIWTKEKLFDFHRKGWEKERQRHVENSRNFEEKHFAANFELLESLQAS